MWGMEPAPAALVARDFFVEQGVRKVLVPGFGYGRNARLFHESGMQVTGIEISGTAVALARRHFGTAMTIHHGPVTAMPFDADRYDGIFCYALIHLLDAAERGRLLRDCYAQLDAGGWMVFVVLSKAAPTYGQGVALGADRFEQFGGVRLYFYDRESIAGEFGPYGLQELREIEENFPFYLIFCRRERAAEAS
jgi:ubiquinone/menaquinone biosynthesis C-methylase UbiE